MKCPVVFILLFLVLGKSAAISQVTDSIVVLPIKMDAPAGSTKLGTIEVGNNATATHCDYEEVVREAKEKAQAMGGNLVKITQIIAPAFISKCYKIKADVYHVENLAAYDALRSNTNSAQVASNYATLYLYRLRDTVALMASYKIHIGDDSVIAKVKSKSQESVTLVKEGELTLWAETAKRYELKLNVHYGESYYVRCGLVKGDLRMTPLLELMDNKTGGAEFGQLKKAKKDMDIGYLRAVH